MTYLAKVDYPHILLQCYADTAHQAIQNLFVELGRYDPQSADMCEQSWTEQEVQQFMDAAGYVDGWCGGYAWRCTKVHS